MNGIIESIKANRESLISEYRIQAEACDRVKAQLEEYRHTITRDVEGCKKIGDLIDQEMELSYTCRKIQVTINHLGDALSTLGIATESFRG